MKDLSSNMFRYHISLFLSEKIKINTLLLASDLYKDFIEVFGGEPQIMPLDDTAPKEIPRCVFRTKDEDCQLFFSLEKIGFTNIIKDSHDVYDEILRTSQMISSICTNRDYLISRIGIAIETSTHENICSWYKEHINIAEIEHSKETTLSWIKESLFKEIAINEITNITYNASILNDKENRIVFDVNTDKNKNLNFSSKQADEFINHIITILKEMITNATE